MSSTNIKLKLLNVMDILQQESDEDHVLTATDIEKKLCARGISASRKSIYDDINTLIAYGFDIIREEGNRGYFLASRDFELTEVKLLIDAVNVAKFIPSKKTDVLIKKLQKLTSEPLASELKRQIKLDEPKNENEKIYYWIDAIHKAIVTNRKIQFQYMKWNEKKEQFYRRDQKIYEVSPWEIRWDSEFYYMLAYDNEISGIKHYRIDYIDNLQIQEDKKCDGYEYYQKYKVHFNSRMFGMYAGDDVNVELRCNNKIAGSIIDKFGDKVSFFPDGENHFRVRVLISLSPLFFAWITSLGEKIEIVRPQNVREQYIEHLNNILHKYENV